MLACLQITDDSMKGKYHVWVRSAQSLFPSFIGALKAKPGSDEESQKQGALVQVRGEASSCVEVCKPELACACNCSAEQLFLL